MIKCDVGAVSSTGSKLTGKAGELDAFLKQVLSEVEGTHGNWVGRGQAQFVELHARWNKAGAELQSVLQEYGAATGRAAEHYDQTDTSVAGMFGGGAA